MDMVMDVIRNLAHHLCLYLGENLEAVCVREFFSADIRAFVQCYFLIWRCIVYISDAAEVMSAASEEFLGVNELHCCFIL